MIFFVVIYQLIINKSNSWSKPRYPWGQNSSHIFMVPELLDRVLAARRDGEDAAQLVLEVLIVHHG